MSARKWVAVISLHLFAIRSFGKHHMLLALMLIKPAVLS